MRTTAITAAAVKTKISVFKTKESTWNPIVAATRIAAKAFMITDAATQRRNRGAMLAALASTFWKKRRTRSSESIFSLAAATFRYELPSAWLFSMVRFRFSLASALKSRCMPQHLRPFSSSSLRSVAAEYFSYTSGVPAYPQNSTAW